MSETARSIARNQEKLDEAAVLIQAGAMEARSLLPFVATKDLNAERETVLKSVDNLNQIYWEILKTLVEIGATPPDWVLEAAKVRMNAHSLTDLATLDTPDSRELLALLEQAQVVAERVDAQRGRVLPADIELQPGESRGTDLSEDLSEIAHRVRGEVHGYGMGME